MTSQNIVTDTGTASGCWSRNRESHSTWWVWLLGLVAVCSWALPSHAVPEDQSRQKMAERVVFFGNDVVPTSLLSYALDLPLDSALGERHRRATEESVESLLHQAGYQLAEAYSYIAEDGRIHVILDEGIISKVRVIGANTPTTLSLRLDFNLPGSVFNSELLKNELDRLGDSYGVARIEARLIHRPPPEGQLMTGRQLEEELTAAYGSRLGALDRRQALASFWSQRRGTWELQLEVVANDGAQGSGFGVDLDFVKPFGLGVEVNWKKQGLLLDDDRFRVAAEVANSTEFLLTRSAAELRWDSPTLGTALRVGLEPDVEIIRLDRTALDVGEFNRFTARLGGLLSAWLGPSRFALGGGYFFRSVFGLQTGSSTPDGVAASTRAGGFFSASAEMVFSPAGRRPDKRSTIDVQSTVFRPTDGDTFVDNRLEAVHVIYDGFDELVLRLSGHWVGGSGRIWSDDRSVNSDAVHVVPGTITFSPLTLSTGLEYRISLFRDVVHLPLFFGTAVYLQEDYEEPPQKTLRYLTSGGVGLGVWIIDSLQFDVYWAHAIRNDGIYGSDVVFELRNTF